GLEARDQLARALAGEEAHRQTKQVLEEVALHGGAGAYADPEREEIVREIEDGLQHARHDVEPAQQQDAGERRRHTLDTDGVEESGAEVVEAEVAEPAGRRCLDAAAERQVED